MTTRAALPAHKLGRPPPRHLLHTPRSLFFCARRRPPKPPAISLTGPKQPNKHRTPPTIHGRNRPSLRGTRAQGGHAIRAHLAWPVGRPRQKGGADPEEGEGGFRQRSPGPDPSTPEAPAREPRSVVGHEKREHPQLEVGHRDGIAALRMIPRAHEAWALATGCRRSQASLADGLAEARHLPFMGALLRAPHLRSRGHSAPRDRSRLSHLIPALRTRSPMGRHAYWDGYGERHVLKRRVPLRTP